MQVIVQYDRGTYESSLTFHMIGFHIKDVRNCKDLVNGLVMSFGI